MTYTSRIIIGYRIICEEGKNKQGRREVVLGAISGKDASEVPFERRPEGSEGANCASVWKESLLARAVQEHRPWGRSEWCVWRNGGQYYWKGVWKMKWAGNESVKWQGARVSGMEPHSSLEYHSNSYFSHFNSLFSMYVINFFICFGNYQCLPYTDKKTEIQTNYGIFKRYTYSEKKIPYPILPQGL